MIDRIKGLLPHFVILIIIIALINVGVIPGKQRILRYLGLARQSEPEPGRSLDYVPGRLLELQPKSQEGQQPPESGTQTQPQPQASPNVSFPSRVLPSPVVASPKINEPPIPPIPPPYIYGVKSDQANPPLPPPADLVGEVNNLGQEESILETFKNFFGGIF